VEAACPEIYRYSSLGLFFTYLLTRGPDEIVGCRSHVFLSYCKKSRIKSKNKRKKKGRKKEIKKKPIDRKEKKKEKRNRSAQQNESTTKTNLLVHRCRFLSSLLKQFFN